MGYRMKPHCNYVVDSCSAFNGKMHQPFRDSGEQECNCLLNYPIEKDAWFNDLYRPLEPCPKPRTEERLKAEIKKRNKVEK